MASYNSSLGETTLRLRSGTLIRGFGAQTLDNLRGWAFDKAWCDEYAPWSRHNAQEGYDMLWSCLREADGDLRWLSLSPLPKHLRCSMEPGWATNLRRCLCQLSKTVGMPSGWEPDGNSKTKKAREGS
ncbi:hypothetical protein NLX86_20235 [Streptomyces sp. A3M-1-3]|uniref:hypothetical protein n=1 Tax=Streptomyces sp. A3M-1-3 TaxID=2962044 RepID=UPI0020B6F88C|nr:hypothetical protein [Streptomyces sp. A3M-1-3]MCP3820341.1 hypothetical protein [Streptomyces sp. A3M-1-3]